MSSHLIKSDIYLLNKTCTVRLGSSVSNIFQVKNGVRLYSSWNMAVKVVFNLPKVTHGYFIEPISENHYFLDLNIYFVAEIKILQLYCKFTTFING